MSFVVSSPLRSIITITMMLCLCFSAFADTIRMKDGSIYKGRVIGFRDGQFIILIGEGTRQRQISLYSDEIAAVEFDSVATPANTVTVNTQPAANTNPPVTQPAKTTTQPNPNVKIIDTTATNKPTSVQTVPVSTKSPGSKPIQINVKVLADNTSNGWTNTGWVVKKGQRIRINSTGRISLGNGRYATPAGVTSLPDSDKLMKQNPTGGLIAVIGDDNNDFIFIGSSNEFVAPRDGALFLGVNEGNLDDNSGAFETTVEIDLTANS